jgi:hypothetical protein
MPRKGGKWIVWLQSHRQPLPADLSELFDDPVPLVRVSAAGAWWGRTGEAKQVRDVVEAAIRTGDRDAVVFGCQVLGEMGPAAGDVVALVWDYLEHENAAIRLNAASALLRCCNEKRVLAQARARLAADTGDRLFDAAIAFVAHKMDKVLQPEPLAPADSPNISS